MKIYDCTTCTRSDCIHRDCYCRLPKDVGGLDLCPGHIAADPVMPDDEIISLVESLKEWKTILEDAKAEVENIRDALKKEMDTRGVEELVAGTHIVRWTTVLSSRFDSTSFKRVAPDVYKQYTKQVTSRRFSVS